MKQALPPLDIGQKEFDELIAGLLSNEEKSYGTVQKGSGSIPSGHVSSSSNHDIKHEYYRPGTPGSVSERLKNRSIKLSIPVPSNGTLNILSTDNNQDGPKAAVTDSAVGARDLRGTEVGNRKDGPDEIEARPSVSIDTSIKDKDTIKPKGDTEKKIDAEDPNKIVKVAKYASFPGSGGSSSIEYIDTTIGQFRNPPITHVVKTGFLGDEEERHKANLAAAFNDLDEKIHIDNVKKGDKPPIVWDQAQAKERGLVLPVEAHGHQISTGSLEQNNNKVIDKLDNKPGGNMRNDSESKITVNRVEPANIPVDKPLVMSPDDRVIEDDLEQGEEFERIKALAHAQPADESVKPAALNNERGAGVVDTEVTNPDFFSHVEEQAPGVGESVVKPNTIKGIPGYEILPSPAKDPTTPLPEPEELPEETPPAEDAAADETGQVGNPVLDTQPAPEVDAPIEAPITGNGGEALTGDSSTQISEQTTGADSVAAEILQADRGAEEVVTDVDAIREQTQTTTAQSPLATAAAPQDEAAAAPVVPQNFDYSRDSQLASPSPKHGLFSLFRHRNEKEQALTRAPKINDNTATTDIFAGHADLQQGDSSEAFK